MLQLTRCVGMQFNSPVEVNWEYMDTGLMQRYWANHEEERSGTASISDRILVFHRGISTVSSLQCMDPLLDRQLMHLKHMP